MQSSYLLLGMLLPFFALDIWYTGILILWIMKTTIIAYLVIFGLLPLIFHYSSTIQRKILFLNFVCWPPSTDFSKPQLRGLEGTRNFYLTTDEKVKIGAWQILPRSLLNVSESWDDEKYEQTLMTAKRPVFLYMHGNSGNRASTHRIELYKLFQELDYHVVCFDYRSYGDSDLADLSEIGVVADSKFVLQWLLKKVDRTVPVFVWGHSLGTGVSSHAIAQLSAEGIQPNGLFLESPFNNIADELSEHPFAQIFKHLPWFHWLIVEPFYGNNLRFESDKHIGNITCPIMILHAEDDSVVPFSLGEKLYEAALKFQGNETNKIQMTRISSSLGFGHKWICRYEELPIIIEKFVAQSRAFR
ncbi:lysophosphatidylserine lipase ABHD12 isoform X3 [Venturia canescens]|uniref:lysophosphatidylserine lipase ABHD12 isoform X3 n=1 Tax=Venturia canescens TaxID=32260 RepID=UPI001C9CF726|nr:lysophosphatidylserine lipase ABHD12 isoform X3 [Venturia canescens]XP_043282749.1 lysophosphatidylserine lipase ABHD12 isoform X3 [Venturia canescens]XP_043282750.1 lysophosphatidylserine lipase ABHD12 isoform X3 [Venturia canescens]